MQPLEWTRYAVGECRHPECMVRRDRGPASQRFPALVFRITHPLHGQVLFDTGYSRHFLDATAALPERLYRVVTPVRLQAAEAMRDQLAREGIPAGHIAHIFLSHLHGDHVGGLPDFPAARAWCARAAIDDLRARGRLSALRVGLLPALLGDGFESRCIWIEDVPMLPLPRELSAFGDGHDLFGDGSLLAVALPGHAAGHYGLAFNDGDGLVFLVADASWSTQALRDAVPPPAITTGWLGDTTTYRGTFARLHALVRDAPQVRVVPSHCPEWLPNGR